MISNHFFKSVRMPIGLLKSMALLSAVIVLSVYGFQARERWIEVPKCKWVNVPNTEGTPYSARVCYFSGNTTLLRVYDESGLHLLAERSYLWTGVYVLWISDEIVYNTSENDGAIAIPPTMLDWLRARLP